MFQLFSEEADNPSGSLLLLSLPHIPMSFLGNFQNKLLKTSAHFPSLCLGKCLFVYCLLLPASEAALLVCSFKSSYSYVCQSELTPFNSKFVVSISSRVYYCSPGSSSLRDCSCPSSLRNAFSMSLFNLFFSLP